MEKILSSLEEERERLDKTEPETVEVPPSMSQMSLASGISELRHDINQNLGRYNGQYTNIDILYRLYIYVRWITIRMGLNKTPLLISIPDVGGYETSFFEFIHPNGWLYDLTAILNKVL